MAKYTVVSPDEKVHSFSHLVAFAKEHGLNPGNLSRVISGQLRHTKYWHLPETNVYTEVVDPEGNLHKITSISAFAKEHGLDKDGVSRLLNGYIS